MTMTLFDARYFGSRRPAWHHLGHPNRRLATAREAFDRAGRYDVMLRPTDEPQSWKIRRGPFPRDPVYRIFGTVGPEFVLVPPDELTELWDRNVREPVETLGAVWYGRCLFMTMQLEDFEVHGDQLQNYLIFAHWLDDTARSEVFLAPVRVVCQNTLRMARGQATHRIVLSGGPDARERIADSLTIAVRATQQYAQAISEECTRLADRRATPEASRQVLQAAFPGDETRQTAALRLFDGAGTGMDSVAARGTLWGLYNAIAELENFREGDTLEQAATSVLFGKRGLAIQRAFDAALACATDTSRSTPRSAEQRMPVAR